MTVRVALFFVAASMFSVVACTSNQPQPESQSQPAPAAAPAADASHGGHTGGRVFFVAPKNGDTIKTNTKFEFGSDMFQIAAVPEGEVTTVRPGVGHFHLGLDTDCLPAGAVIPKADPWIHFGTGSNNIEMTLKPGRHKLSVQAGDDKHQTLAGLCETIEVNVTE